MKRWFMAPSYKEQLDLFSEAVFRLKSLDESTTAILKDQPFDGMAVYHNNLLYGSIDRLQDDFQVTYAYLEDNNFRFLVRKFLLEERITSANIVDQARGFSVFLEAQKPFHQDEILPLFAQIDLLMTHGHVGEKIQVPKGAFLMWSHLLKGKEAYHLQVDLSQMETVKVVVKDNTKALSCNQAIC